MLFGRLTKLSWAVKIADSESKLCIPSTLNTMLNILEHKIECECFSLFWAKKISRGSGVSSSRGSGGDGTKGKQKLRGTKEGGVRQGEMLAKTRDIRSFISRMKTEKRRCSPKTLVEADNSIISEGSLIGPKGESGGERDINTEGMRLEPMESPTRQLRTSLDKVNSECDIQVDEKL